MPRLPQPREGNIYKVNGNREIPFSFWPVEEHSRRGRKGIQERLYSNDPWSAIQSSINTKALPAAKIEANYFVAQAKDYFDAATLNRLEAAKPVLLYYCALNLAKALLITHGGKTTLDNAKHGLTENNLRSNPPINHTLGAFPTTARDINIFYDLHNYFTGSPFTDYQQIPVRDLMKQIILGHRIFVGIENVAERFVHIKEIEYINSATNDALWLRLYFDKQDVAKRLNRTMFLRDSNLFTSFSEVTSGKDNLICFEQINPTSHRRWPSDALQATSNLLKNDVWTVLLTFSPYTRHYVFLRQSGEIVFPQLLSIYALLFYLGSVTRYRPFQFQELIQSKYGGFINEFVNNQIVQLLYMFAAEFEKREVSKPSVI